MARFSVVSKVAAASSDLLLAELISRSISVMLASARSASALEMSMISLNFWNVKHNSVVWWLRMKDKFVLQGIYKEGNPVWKTHGH